MKHDIFFVLSSSLSVCFAMCFICHDVDKQLNKTSKRMMKSTMTSATAMMSLFYLIWLSGVTGRDMCATRNIYVYLIHVSTDIHG